jgi:hypothetical protein
MNTQEAAGWEWAQAEQERMQITVEALNRCAAAGAHHEDLITLARECGIDPNLIKLTNPQGT